MATNMYQFAFLEMRKKDKVMFIDLLGEEQLTSVLKTMLPTLYEPLIEMYAHADIPGSKDGEEN